jgi:succinate-semialdehyde dehydrogenase/glutarate-semialdehyde dehydrogenase
MLTDEERNVSIESRDPSDETRLAVYDEMSSREVDDLLEACAAAQRAWGLARFDERARILVRAADVLDERRDRYAELMTREMGKPIADARSELEKCAWVCRFYAERGEEFLADENVDTEASRSAVVYRPLGVVLAVMPWNFPFWQVFRFLAPTLMAGNGGVLKHAENVTGCALAIEEVVRDAGLPDGLFRALRIRRDSVPRVIQSRSVAAVTLTGSTAAGRSVAAEAGRSLKPSVLELGGSDPYVVLADADLDAAVRACSRSRMTNGGQSCIAAKRFIVERPLYASFVEGMRAALAEYEPRDPHDPETKLGPMARVDLRDELHEQVARSVEAGARCSLGGSVPERKGAWYPATVLCDVASGMAAFDEETFGPVAAISVAEDERQAIELANRSTFGLGGAVFTADEAKGWEIATRHLEVGCSFVNDSVRSDPRLPFGGIKDSGYGRELGPFGIRAFANVKSAWLA